MLSSKSSPSFRLAQQQQRLLLHHHQPSREEMELLKSSPISLCSRSSPARTKELSLPPRIAFPPLRRLLLQPFVRFVISKVSSLSLSLSLPVVQHAQRKRTVFERKVSAFFLGFCIILGFQFENLWPRIKESQREKKRGKKKSRLRTRYEYIARRQNAINTHALYF